MSCSSHLDCDPKGALVCISEVKTQMHGRCMLALDKAIRKAILGRSSHMTLCGKVILISVRGSLITLWASDPLDMPRGFISMKRVGHVYIILAQISLDVQ
jgi:hypothetical protein